MAYSSSGKTHVEESVNLDSVVIYLKKILQHWKIVVISAVVLAVLGFAVAKLTYTPSYSSKITFIANNKSSALAVSVRLSRTLTRPQRLPRASNMFLQRQSFQRELPTTAGLKIFPF